MIILFRDPELGFTIEWTGDQEFAVFNAAYDKLMTLYCKVGDSEDAHKFATTWYYTHGRDAVLAGAYRRIERDSIL